MKFSERNSLHLPVNFMQMRNLISLIVLSGLFLLTACKKDEEEVKIVPPPSNFQPTGAGSTWSYADYPFTTLYSVYMTGIDSTFNKKKYKEVFTTNAGYSWLRKENGSYYRLIPYMDTVVEFLYLKDNVVTGSSWKSTFEYAGFPATYEYVLTEFDQPKLINGEIYNRCATVRENLLVDFGMGSDSLMATWEYTYANDVGLVFIKRDIPGDFYLKSYIIK